MCWHLQSWVTGDCWCYHWLLCRSVRLCDTCILPVDKLSYSEKLCWVFCAFPIGHERQPGSESLAFHTNLQSVERIVLKCLLDYTQTNCSGKFQSGISFQWCFRKLGDTCLTEDIVLMKGCHEERFLWECVDEAQVLLKQIIICLWTSL